MILVENISKAFKLNRQQQKELGLQSKEVYAVNGLSLECQPGRIFSLLGPNGAGKTTLLRMIATILQPSSGKITVMGKDSQKEGKAVRSSMGFLTGSTGLYDRLTANEFVRYFADLNGVSKTDFNQRRDYLFELLGMEDFAKKRIGKLSVGMKQKVSLARTMIHDPAVVVFDEPTSGLDVITAENIIRLIRDCKEQGKTIIFSSHIMSEVDLLCDDLAIIHQGKLLFNDTMEQFRKEAGEKSLTEEFIRRVRQAPAEI